ncbi:MAG TPA: hypothetical protein VHB99_13285, partial [Pirellulales bacterium]|nr:hypothetical protein [Pirellulales bacterium]
MKYALILILACLPLLALTGWSFVQAFDSGAAPDAAALDAQLAEASELADKTAKDVAAETPLVQALAKTDVL